jgi:RND family efflux transporter MFP subunit
MNDKSALLDQLRIDRTQPSHERGGGGSRWLIGGLGVAALAAIAAVWLLARPGVAVRAVIATALPEAAPGASLLDASGYVVALREATVSAKSIYKVEEVLIQEGQAVRQGELLAKLDDSNTRAALEQSKAQVKQLQAALYAARVAAADARPSFTRNQSQLAEGLISPEKYDASKSSFDAAQTAMLVAEQNLAVAKAAEEVNQRFENDTVIKAPFDGVVTVKTAQPGEIVSPQFLGGGGIAKIVDMGSLEVDVDVGENFINRVHAEQPAEVTLNAYPELRIPAAVIAVIPTAERSKATVKVRIGFKTKDARIVPEMGARVSFMEESATPHAKVARGSAGVLVPAEAVRSEGAAGVVFVINGNAVERRAVKLGARTAGGQTILAGLQPGAVLAIGDLSKLSDHTRVRVTP